MEIGIALPVGVSGVERRDVLGWARRAEARGFSSVAAGDRVVYPSYEPLVALAAAAAVTERIRLMTNVLILPNRSNPAVVAKQLATVDALAEGRLVAGVGLGGRADDYGSGGLSTRGRGRRLDEMLAEIRRIWAGEERGYAGRVGPVPAQPGGPPLLIGGTGDVAVRRAVEHGDGWTMGEGTPEDFEGTARRVKTAWSEAGRRGHPRLVALCYFSLGDGAAETADRYLRDYYGWLGNPPDIVLQPATSPDQARRQRDAFAHAGADELVFFPTSTVPRQVDLLAEAVL